MQGVLLAARLGLAAVFLSAGVSKLFDRAGAREAVAGFGVPVPLAPAVAAGLPLAELAVGAALVPIASARIAAAGAVALLAAFSLAIAINLIAGNAPECHCFGQLTRGRLSWWSLARNAGLGALAAFAAAAHQRGATVGSALGELSPTERFAVLGLLVSVPAVAIQWRVLLGALARNGRSLLALEHLEMAASIGAGLVPAGLHTSLPVGSPAPDFSLACVDGRVVTRDALTSRGRTVLLIFTDVGCSPCRLLLPEVVRWQTEYGDRVTVAIIARGELDGNRVLAGEYGVHDVLVQRDREISEAYRVPATPCAVIVRPDQTIGSGVAPGGEQIRLLLAAALRGAAPRRPAGDSHIRPSPAGPRPAAAIER